MKRRWKIKYKDKLTRSYVFRRYKTKLGIILRILFNSPRVRNVAVEIITEDKVKIIDELNQTIKDAEKISNIKEEDLPDESDGDEESEESVSE